MSALPTFRYFLDAGESFLRALDRPSPLILFEKLLRRLLVNVHKEPDLSVLCCRSLIRLYSVCHDSIGGFDDMLLIVKMLDEATNMELQHCLIDFLELLLTEESNLKQLLDRSFVESIIKFASLAHLNPDQIGNVLARATNSRLLITASSSEPVSPRLSSSTNNSAYNTPNGKHNTTTDLSEGQQLKRSLWLPDDSFNPRVWFVAPKGPLPPPTHVQRGPFRVSDLMDMLDRGDVEGMMFLGGVV